MTLDEQIMKLVDETHHANDSGFLAQLEALLSQGANPGQIDGDMNSIFDKVALQSADAQLPVDALRLLISYGAQLHANTLCSAVMLNKTERFLELLQLYDDLPEDILHCAFRWTDDPKLVVSALIERGMDINAKDEEGNTPLHTLGYRDHPLAFELIEYAISLGADLQIHNRQNQTARDTLSTNDKQLFDVALAGHALQDQTRAAVQPTSRRAL